MLITVVANFSRAGRCMELIGFGRDQDGACPGIDRCLGADCVSLGWLGSEFGGSAIGRAGLTDMASSSRRVVVAVEA